MENEIRINEVYHNLKDNGVMKLMGQKAHVWVTLGKGGNKTRVKALLDTGNTIVEETAITSELHKQLQVGFGTVGGVPIGTANKEGPKLMKLGVSNPIEMEISGINGKFLVKPAVVPILSDRFYMGSGFLSTIGNQLPVSVSFENGKATLKIGNMETEIVRQMTDDQQMGTEQVDREDHGKSQKSQDDQDHTKEEPKAEGTKRESRKLENKENRRKREHGPMRRQQVYATKDAVCRSNTVNFIEVQTERPISGGLELLVENDDMNQMETVEAIYTWQQTGMRIAVMNNANQDFRILKNSSLGFISQVEVDKEENESKPNLTWRK